MRQTITSFAVASALALAVFSAVRADQSPSRARGKTASKAAPAPVYGNSDAISEDELKIHLYFLAADQLEGRNLPSRGYDIASLYVATQVAGWGLTPMGSKTGTLGPLQPYFQPMEMVARQIVPEETKLTLTAPAAGRGGRGFGGGGGGQGGGARGGNANAEPQTTTYEYTKDWTTVAGGRGGSSLTQTLDVSGNLVFAGNGYVLNKTKVNPYEGLDVKGKIVVVAGVPAEVAALQNAGGRGGRGGGAAATPVAPAAGGAAPARHRQCRQRRRRPTRWAKPARIISPRSSTPRKTAPLPWSMWPASSS